MCLGLGGIRTFLIFKLQRSNVLFVVGQTMYSHENEALFSFSFCCICHEEILLSNQSLSPQKHLVGTKHHKYCVACCMDNRGKAIFPSVICSATLCIQVVGQNSRNVQYCAKVMQTKCNEFYREISQNFMRKVSLSNNISSDISRKCSTIFQEDKQKISILKICRSKKFACQLTNQCQTK